MARILLQTMRRRRFLLAAAGFTGTAVLAACSSSNSNSNNNKPSNVPAATTNSGAAPAAPSTAVPAASTGAGGTPLAADLNAQGWPKSISKLSVGLIPSEADTNQQKSDTQPLISYIAEALGVPSDLSITTSYGALVEAQKNHQVNLGYYGPLSFLLAEQQFGAIPIVVDSTDGKTPGNYHSILIAGKNSPVKTTADIKGKDFTFVDPASTSGYLFPIAMLKSDGIDPAKDIKARFAGSHGNSILAVAKGQVPCGATNDGNLAQAIGQGAIAKDDIVVLQTSDPIPNGPFAVNPDMDKRAIALLIKTMVSFNDPKVFTAVGLQGPLVPIGTSLYDYVRQVAKVINLQFDDKGNTIIPGAPTPAGTP